MSTTCTCSTSKLGHYGENVFNLKAMRNYLSENAYQKLVSTIVKGEALDHTLADEVADAMKTWALEKNATHFTHLFQPLTGVAAEKHDQAGELERIAAEYPLPMMDRLALKYDRTQAGIVKIHTITGMADGKPTWEPIATPCGVKARLRYADKADAYGLRVIVMGMDGQPRFLDFDRGELAIMAGSEIRSALLKAGLRVEDNGDQTLVQALKAADPVDEITVVSRTGWHRIDGGVLVFVGPGGDVIGTPPASHWS